MERVLSHPDVATQRVPSLVHARGRVLEVGFGCGGSLSAYPTNDRRVSRLVALEPNPGMIRRAERHAAAAAFPVQLVQARAEAIPSESESFDTVVSHWSLCSIPDLPAAMDEIRRVLRPDGRFLFLEHGSAADARLRRSQKRWSPIHSFLAGGCRLDIAIDDVIRSAGLEIEDLVRYEARPGPRIFTQMYRGIARRPQSGGA